MSNWLFSLKKDKYFRHVCVCGIKFSFFRSCCKKKIAETLIRMEEEGTNGGGNYGQLNQLEKMCKDAITKMKRFDTLPTHYINILRTFAQSLVLPSINRDEVSSLVENMRTTGIQYREKGPKLIVSLTSYPKRMYDIHMCIYSLLSQTTRPDKVILWLAEEQFPNREKDIPQKVLQLCQYGLEIRWCPDYKSHKKLVPALQTFPDDVIVTADDDLYYAPDWLEKLWNKYQELKQGVIAHRCHRIKIQDNNIQPYTSWQFCIRTGDSSYLNFQTNGGGTLYSPGSIHPDVLNVDKAMELCPRADDVWFWGMTVLAGTKIHVLDDPNPIVYTNAIREVCLNQDETLFSTNKVGGNDTQIRNLFNAYPEIWKKVLQEYTETTKA